MGEQVSGGAVAAPPTGGPAEGPSAGPTTAPSRGAVKPGWLPFSVVLTVLVLMIGSSVALGVSAPERAEGSTGFYERVVLMAADGEAPVFGGFLAPEGWLRDAPAEDEAGAGAETEAAEAGEGAEPEAGDDFPTSAGFASASGDMRLEGSLQLAPGGANELLRGSAPTGAVLAPVRTIDAGSGYETRMIEYDLGVGTGFTQSFAVCADARAADRVAHCLLFEVDVLDDARDPLEVDPAVAAVLRSAEVF